MIKPVKVTLIVAAILAVLIAGAGFAVGNIMYNLALDPHADKSAIFGDPEEGGSTMSLPDELLEATEQRRIAQRAWQDSTPQEDVYMMSDDGLNLHALRVKNESASGNRWAILCHGYTGHLTEMLYGGSRFYEMGFSVLLPDARGHGQSEGDYIGMGWDERKDIVGWIDTILQEDPDAEIVLYGVSMGGATVMMTSGEDLPDNVKAVVEDCGYSSVWDEFSFQLDELFGLPSFPIMEFSSGVTYVRAGWWLGEASSVDQVERSITPTLFIHGTEDDFVPYSMLDVVYEACDAPKDKYEVEGAGHGMASLVAGEEYWDRIEGFIDPYLGE